MFSSTDLSINISSNLPLETIVIVFILFPDCDYVIYVVPQVLLLLNMLFEGISADRAIKNLVRNAAHEAHFFSILDSRHKFFADFHELIKRDTYMAQHSKYHIHVSARIYVTFNDVPHNEH
jgi:hypothetical protein